VIIDQEKLERILPTVSKPGRYTGGEWNSVVKNWESTPTKVALAFPDVYDLGMSNLGLSVLYDQLNRRDDVLAERMFSPWPDMEAAMREAGIPLYSLETKHVARDFDLLGISLPYEQIYTNALNLLDLAHMPVLAAERDERFPLVMAGGHAAFNPEPMADFVDFFVVGEGEEVIHEIVDTFDEVRDADRQTQLRRMARIDGVYVPGFYRDRYLEDGTLAEIAPVDPAAPAVVTKRIVSVLPPPPTRFVVPFVDTVFNRAAVEIQRGCTRGCRFCQAGMVVRPVRERPLSVLLKTVDEIVRCTGYEEIALLSLSSSDYTEIRALVEAVAERYRDRHLNISLPSMRIESFSVDLADALTDGRRSGFTFAPEAASERMRRVINKFIPEQQLLEVAEQVYSRGWRTIKLYFMIGQPTETDEDVQAIADLAQKVIRVGRRHHGRRAAVRVGVSTFVPKPHTPFQWEPMASLQTVRRRQEILQRGLRGHGVTLNWSDPQQSLLEATLSRGDRRLAAVIHTAWRNGARFDGWHDQFRPRIWWESFAAHHLDPSWYAHRRRLADEVFPWDHIDVGLQKRWLLTDYRRSLQEETLLDCREHCYACGILRTYRNERAATPPDAWKCPPIKTPRLE
jgi:radical SAM family uncharacterized protein